MRDFIARQNSERLRQRLSRSVKVREPQAFAKLAQSTIDMALVTGVIARLYRALIITRYAEDSVMYAAMLGLGAVFVLLMATLHLSRFPLRHWVTKAPLFALLEGVFEMIASLALISLGRERIGTVAAELSDWPGMAARAILWRTITVSVFALILAGIVKWVRYLLARRDHEAWSAGTVRSGIPGEDFIERRRTGGKGRFPDESLVDRRRSP